MSLFHNHYWKTIIKNAKSLGTLFAVKVGLAGGAVYYISEQGVWKESTKTTKLYEHISNTISPYMQEAKSRLPFKVPDLPNSNKVSYLTKQYWNRGVTGTFTYMGDLPSHVPRWTKQGVDAAKKNPEIKKILESFSSNSLPPAIKEK